MGRRSLGDTSMEANAIRVAKALKYLSDEHGLPNSFRAVEIATTAGMIAMHVGLTCNSRFVRHIIDADLAKAGIKYKGYRRTNDGSYVDVEQIKGAE